MSRQDRAADSFCQALDYTRTRGCCRCKRIPSIILARPGPRGCVRSSCESGLDFRVRSVVVSRADAAHAATSTYAFASIAAFVLLLVCLWTLFCGRPPSSKEEHKEKLNSEEGEARPPRQGKDDCSTTPSHPLHRPSDSTQGIGQARHLQRCFGLAAAAGGGRRVETYDERSAMGPTKGRNYEKGLLPWCHTRLCLVVFPLKPFNITRE